MEPETTEQPRFNGIYRAKVVSVDDPEKRGRVTMRVPGVLGDVVTGWAWPVTDTAAPHPGAGVWAMFDGGDPEFPVWVGSFKPTHTSLPPVGGGSGFPLTPKAAHGWMRSGNPLSYGDEQTNLLNQGALYLQPLITNGGHIDLLSLFLAQLYFNDSGAPAVFRYGIYASNERGVPSTLVYDSGQISIALVDAPSNPWSPYAPALIDYPDFELDPDILYWVGWVEQGEVTDGTSGSYPPYGHVYAYVDYGYYDPPLSPIPMVLPTTDDLVDLDIDNGNYHWDFAGQIPYYPGSDIDNITGQNFEGNGSQGPWSIFTEYGIASYFWFTGYTYYPWDGRGGGLDDAATYGVWGDLPATLPEVALVNNSNYHPYLPDPEVGTVDVPILKGYPPYTLGLALSGYYHPFVVAKFR